MDLTPILFVSDALLVGIHHIVFNEDGGDRNMKKLPGFYHQIINTVSSSVEVVASYFRNDGKLVSHRAVSEELTEVYSGRVT